MQKESRFLAVAKIRVKLFFFLFYMSATNVTHMLKQSIQKKVKKPRKQGEGG